MSKILPFFIWNGNESIKSSSASSYEFSLQFTLQRFQNLIFCYVCKIWCLHHPTICWFITRRLQTTHSQGAFQLFLFCLAELGRRCLYSSCGRVCLSFANVNYDSLLLVTTLKSRLNSLISALNRFIFEYFYPMCTCTPTSDVAVFPRNPDLEMW